MDDCGMQVYRCSMICIEYWWVAIVPGISTLAAVGEPFHAIYALHRTYSSETVLWFLSAYLTHRLGGPTTRKFAAASTLLTVSTNIIVTSLIAFRLLRARRSLAKVLPSADLRLYTGVVAILIESALPLTVFGIIAAIMQQLDYQGYQLSESFPVCNVLFVGLFYIFCVRLLCIYL